MSDTLLRRLTWIIVIMTVVILCISAVMLALVADFSNLNWLENQVRSIVGLGAPILGLIILTRQPRQRIGWLWIVYGIMMGFRTLGHAVYYYSGAQPAGYSTVEYFLLWSTEAANLGLFVCLTLLLLWFPDGQPPSRRWRYLYLWLFLAISPLFLSLFSRGPHWNGGAEAMGIIIDNPYGWLLEGFPFIVNFSAFISIILMMILASVSLIFRYRPATLIARMQLRWFVFGGVLLVGLTFIPFFLIGELLDGSALSLIFSIIGFAAIVPLYFAVGIAILRYHLYDFEVVVRKTAVYAILTGMLALVYFGMIILLQMVVGQVTVENSPLIIVISTLVIAALFSPLRRRIQDVIDRRFFRKKYNAQQVLMHFSQVAQEEMDIDELTAELVRVVQEAIEPETLNLWLMGSNH